MLYFLLVVPLADVIFRTPLLSKVQISEFILDYLTRTPILLAVLIAFYLATLILGARLVFAFPIIVFDHLKSAQAVKKKLAINGALPLADDLLEDYCFSRFICSSHDNFLFSNVLPAAIS